MATPRATRSRKTTPLPAIAAKSSAAYGSVGKANLRSQVRPAGLDFNQAFPSARAASEVDGDDGEEAEEEVVVPPAPSPTKRARGGKGKTRAAPEPAPEDGEESEAAAVPQGDRTVTGLDLGGVYRPQPIRRPSPEIHVHQVEVPVYVPSRLRDLLAFFGLFMLSMTIWAFAPVPESFTIARETFFNGLKTSVGIRPFDLPPTELENAWYRFKHDHIFSRALPQYNMPDLQWSININFLERIEKVEKKIKALEGDMSLQSETLATLQEMLPSHVVLRVVSGKYEIPEDFWQALQERLATDDDLAPLWKSYITHNEQQIQHLNQQLVSLTFDRAMQDKQIISQDAFMQAIQENNDWLASRYRDEFRQMQQTHFEDLRSLAVKTTQDVIDKSPASMYATKQLETLARANHIHNTYESLRSINWFSVGLGARVDPYLTSPTHKVAAQSILGKVYRWVSPIIIRPHPPIQALQRWEETTDCWCGAVNDQGSTQIGIHISQKIYPERLIIEHVPAQGTPNIAAAPQEVEVWAHAGSVAAANKLEKAMESHVAYIPECGERPTPDAVCILKGRYDIHQYNYVQSFPVFAETKSMAFGVNKFTVRASTNWGSKWTCLYRLRMIGERVFSD